MTALSTALGGTLENHPNGWRWRDGALEPRVRHMLLANLAPNFRCITYGDGTYVEIPHDWRDRRHWAGRPDPEAANIIAELIRAVGKERSIYAAGLAEVFDNHRLSKYGALVPIAQWDAALCEPCGVWWDKADETDILSRARSLGWQG